MARVPITVLGCRCDRCDHEWVPRDPEQLPAVCPRCKSAYWNRPRKSMMSYEDFRDTIAKTIRESNRPLTWTEIRTISQLPQMFPNNQWVHRLERDIELKRVRDKGGVIYWQIG